MAQIYERKDPWASFGTGLGQGLNNLIEHKMETIKQQRERERQAQAYKQWGFTPEEARELPNFSPQVQQAFIKHKLQQGENSAYEQAIGSLSGQPQQHQQVQQPQASKVPMQEPTQVQQQQPKAAPAMMAQEEKEIPTIEQFLENPGILEIPEEYKISPLPKLKEYIGPAKNKELRKQLVEQYNAERNNRLQQNKHNWAINKEKLNGIDLAAQASEKNIRDYDTLLNLAEKGNIRSGTVHFLLEKFGFEDFMRNVDTQLAAKTIERMVQNAASAFNTKRLTNLEIESYRNSLPSLFNTKEGLIAISKINRLAEEANIIKKKIKTQLLKGTDVLPANAGDLIDEMAEPYLKQLGQGAQDIINQALAQRHKNKILVDENGEKWKYVDGIPMRVE